MPIPVYIVKPSPIGTTTVILESIVIGGLIGLVLWQTHPVFGILGFFGSITVFLVMMAIPIVSHAISLALSSYWAYAGGINAYRNHMDAIWITFIVVTIFALSLYLHLGFAAAVGRKNAGFWRQRRKTTS